MARVESSQHKDFFRQIGFRLRAEWWVKAIGVTLGIAVFFAGYFELLNAPRFPVTVMPVTAIDRFVEFRPAALVLYVSLWVYVPLGFGLLKNRRELFAHGVAAAALSVIGLAIFLVWPTAVPEVGATWAVGSAFSFLKSIDASGNACPSLHVAFAVFTAIGLERLLREIKATVFFRAVNWLWCVGIVYSTLATRQHVALDAVAGAALGAVVGLPRFTGRSGE